MTYNDTHAAVLEVLTDQAPNAYKAYLRDRQISYIIAGHDQLDAPLLLRKLKHDLHMERVMLGGGGVLNWSFIQQGLCDELSVVISPAADADSDSPSPFTAVPGFSTTDPIAFSLEMVQSQGDAVWLRYTIDNAQKETN